MALLQKFIFVVINDINFYRVDEYLVNDAKVSASQVTDTFGEGRQFDISLFGVASLCSSAS